MNAKKVRAVRSSALQRALHEQDDLAHQPVRLVRDQRPIDREHRVAIALGPDHDRADLRLVDPQPQQRIVELAKRAQRPELIAGLQDLVRRRRLRAGRRLHGEIRRPLVAVERQRHRRVGDRRRR